MPKKKPTTAYSEIRVDAKRPYTEILLIRHCHPDYSLKENMGDSDMPLSRSGINQRRYLTEKLLKANIDVIYSSELKRAKQTAVSYVNKTKKELIINPRLN
jgi:probable phosphoglycerate mutase